MAAGAVAGAGGARNSVAKRSREGSKLFSCSAAVWGTCTNPARCNCSTADTSEDTAETWMVDEAGGGDGSRGTTLDGPAAVLEEALILISFERGFERTRFVVDGEDDASCGLRFSDRRVDGIVWGFTATRFARCLATAVEIGARSAFWGKDTGEVRARVLTIDVTAGPPTDAGSLLFEVVGALWLFKLSRPLD